jgi:hypothetical protein
MQETITVYWAPAQFVKGEDSWTHLYAEPKPLLSSLNVIRNKSYDTTMFNCPSYIDLAKKIYTLNNLVEHTIKLPTPDIGEGQEYPRTYLHQDNMLGLREPRPSSFNGYVNMTVNMGWIFFADEPLLAKFTAPYFPPTYPVEGAILSAGEFDIGSWYRKFELDYHLPIDATELKFKQNELLAFIEFKTDKKIVFKRYILTEHLRQLYIESSNSPVRYGRKKPLSYRYEMFKNAKVKEQILTEIKKNLID